MEDTKTKAQAAQEESGLPKEGELTIEEYLAQLDDIAQKLESRDISLEDSFVLYQKGMELLKKCSGKIDAVEKKMLVMNQEGGFDEF